MSTVVIEIEHGIANVVLARPEARNALTEQMGIELERAVADINARDDVRVVLLSGEGKCFSAGGDLGFLQARAAASPDENRRAMRRFYGLFLSVRDLRVPSIAVVHGAAMGAGVCLALSCDLRLADGGASLALNFVRLGLHPGMGASWLLPRLVGPARAAELLLTGRTISAAEALAMGLVNAVHPAAELAAAARALAESIAAAAPLAVAHCKRSLIDTSERCLDEQLEAEARAQSLEYGTADLLEGVAAARERRVPVFKGR